MRKYLLFTLYIVLSIALFAAIVFEKLSAVIFLLLLIPSTAIFLFLIYTSIRILILEWGDCIKNDILYIFTIIGSCLVLYFVVLPFYKGGLQYIFTKPSGKYVVPKTYYYDSDGEEHETYATVYICTGPNSTKFHYDEYCKGLKNCSGEIEEILLEDAEIRDFEPCSYCYE